ncbi:peptide chain release factor N(5)-glutamine methyltransferase [Anoxynatronum sibiricum]|uniref:Release factor glutamine methyltransferase n=2 Tax=Anoxynatronum sibiricum TaxID=210623 RepID=A0ABU9VW93_9CLOT
MTCREWLKVTEQRLSLEGATTPRLDAEVLLAHVLQVERIRLHMYPERPLAEGEVQQADRLLERRLHQEPVAYIIECQEFMGFDFHVNPAVLIPRPETELLVERVVDWLNKKVSDKNAGEEFQAKNETLPAFSLQGADIGTGSGCIAVSLAKLVPEIMMLAVDLSSEALGVAAENILRHQLTHRVIPLAGDLLEPVVFYLENRALPQWGHGGGCLDFIVSNPPYINEKDMAALSPSVAAYEPVTALAGGADGLDYYRRLAAASPRLLCPGGLLALEIGYDQGNAVVRLLEEQGFLEVKCLQDLAGIDRVVMGIRPSVAT